MSRKPRRLKTLYKILLKKGNHKTIIEEGICFEIIALTDNKDITYDEMHILEHHFVRQRPLEDNHPEFYYRQLNANEVGRSAYWWPCERQEAEEEKYPYDRIPPKNVRTKFIEHLIKTL